VVDISYDGDGHGENECRLETAETSHIGGGSRLDQP